MMELNLLGAGIALSWMICLTPQSWLSVLIAALIYFSKSTPVSLLFLLTLNLIAFIQSTRGSRRAGNVLAQKRFFITLFGVFCAIFGASLGDEAPSRILLFVGLLISLPTAPNLIFFHRFYERLTLSSYMGSVVLPAMMAIEILYKTRPEIKADYGQLWDIALSVLGLFTYIYSSVMAFLRLRMKASLIYFAQAGIGLALFILMIDQEVLGRLTLAAISISVVSSVALVALAAQLGDRYHSFSKISYLGLPGMVGFTSLFFATKMAISLNQIWLAMLLLGYFFQAVTLISYESYSESEATPRLRVRFWLVVLVQVCSGVGLYWMGGPR